MKTCTGCGHTKPLDDFHRKATGGQGRQPRCKTCFSEYHKGYHRRTAERRRAYARDYYWANRERIQERERQRYTPKKYKDYALRKNYGISLAEYGEMLAAQGGVCAICAASPSDRELAVDHDHETGVVRALLCGPCNRSLGLLKEDPTILRRAADYVEGFGK